MFDRFFSLSPFLSLSVSLSLSHLPVSPLALCVVIRAPHSSSHSIAPRLTGTYAQLLRTGQRGYAQVKMSSGEVRFLPVEALATVGTVSNPFHKLEVLGTAGANRRRGIRPHVRGVAMNPCDHPMGGRGGRGMPSTSPWGKITKGKFTVKKHLCKFIIRPRPTRNQRKRQPIRKSGKFTVQDEMESALFGQDAPTATGGSL